MDRHLEGISTIPDDPNIFTRLSSGTNNSPRDPFYGPVKWNHVQHSPIYIYVHGCLYSILRHRNHRKQQILCRYVKNQPIDVSYLPLQDPSYVSAVFHNSTVPNLFNLSFFMGFVSGFPLLDLNQGFWQELTQVFPIQFDPRFSDGFDSVFLTRFDSLFLMGFN